ncbi:hypothetical protein ABZ766_20405 [Streptomyces sp. NPDC006670]
MARQRLAVLEARIAAQTAARDRLREALRRAAGQERKGQIVEVSITKR